MRILVYGAGNIGCHLCLLTLNITLSYTDDSGNDLIWKEPGAMNVLQQYQLWIGFGFVGLIVVFFMIAFFKAPDLTSGQLAILRFLGALCAGFAGALIAGDALFKMQSDLGEGTKLAITGTAGFALFFTVWFFFPKKEEAPPPAKDVINLAIPDGWTFKQAVDSLGQHDGRPIQYEGFTDDELQARLRSWQLKARDVPHALEMLRAITAETGAIRPYRVDVHANGCTLKIET